MLYEIALCNLPGVGDKMGKHLISYLGGAEQVFKANKKRLLSVNGIGNVLADNILSNTQSALITAEETIKKCEKENIKTLFYTQAEYPKRLKEIADAPILLYQKGNADLNAQRTVAIVGTRNASSYGKEVTAKIVSELVPYNVNVISGLAYGIDIEAHKACLKMGLPTVGVLGCGIDIVYPSQHKLVAKEMEKQGALVSEYGMGVKPDAPRFPQRNRIIVGLADAVIVVETADKGGTLITAEIAFSYNKEVYAVPGNIDSKYSEGCNNLLVNQKANVLLSANQIIKDFNWDKSESNSDTKAISEIIDFSALSNDEQKVVQLLSTVTDIQIDELSWKTQISISTIASMLLGLEFAGIVKMMPGKKVKLVK